MSIKCIGADGFGDATKRAKVEALLSTPTETPVSIMVSVRYIDGNQNWNHRVVHQVLEMIASHLNLTEQMTIFDHVCSRWRQISRTCNGTLSYGWKRNVILDKYPMSRWIHSIGTARLKQIRRLQLSHDQPDPIQMKALTNLQHLSLLNLRRFDDVTSAVPQQSYGFLRTLTNLRKLRIVRDVDVTNHVTSLPKSSIQFICHQFTHC